MKLDRILAYFFMSVCAILVTGVALNGVIAQTTGGDKITRNRMAVAMVQDPGGTLTPYANWAAYPWHLGTVAPDRSDGGIDIATNLPIPGWPTNPATGKPVLKWPLIAEYNGQPSIVWYYNKSFRTSNGSAWGKPLRWAYVRIAEEVWNPATKQFDVPGLAGAPSASFPPLATGKPGVHMDNFQGQAMVDDLKRSFTWEQIMTFGDLSPYDEPDTGAPMGPGAPR